MTEIICTLITAIVGIITTVIGVYLKSTMEKNEKREQRRQTESLLSLQMMSATLELTEATANAVLGKTNNGNVEKAYQKTNKAKQNYIDFEQKILSEEIA